MNLWDDFVELTQAVFAPLENDFGFQRLPPKQPFAIYESPTLQVSLYYDLGRHSELDLRIQRAADVGTRKPSRGISSLMAIHDPAAWDTYSISYPKDRKSLESSLLAMREQLLKYGTSLLAGDMGDLGKLDHLEEQVEIELGQSGRDANYKDTVRQVILRFYVKG
jgi:hypothetical protein